MVPAVPAMVLAAALRWVLLVLQARRVLQVVQVLQSGRLARAVQPRTPVASELAHLQEAAQQRRPALEAGRRPQ